MYLGSIPFKPDYDTIFSRLGYKKRTGTVPASFRDEVKGYIEEASSLIKLRGSVQRLKIDKIDSDTISVNTASSDNFTINSKSLSKFLKKSTELLFMAVTGGDEIMKAIEKEQNRDMTKAVVLDAAAGEIVDSGLDYITALYRRDLLRESKTLLDKRFSPGYGDLGLEIQKVIYNILALEKLGITLTESFMMVPQKSVIAVTGII